MSAAPPERGHARPTQPPDSTGRLFFTSAGRTCLIHADGTGLRPLELHVPGQATWQPCGFLPDRSVLLLSMEPRRDGPGRPFDQYYHQTPTHLWAYDLDRGTLTELATQDRLAPFYTPQLLLHDGRVLMQVIRTRPGQTYNMNLDGTEAREFTAADEGLPYGFSLSPDGQRVAFHLASPQGYQIWTCDTLGMNRVLVEAHPDHLYFGPTWSPDGQWLLYQDCQYRVDPGHDWSDVCLGRPDGSEHRVVTEGQSMWFGATYGHPGSRGGGSNVPCWTGDGQILYPRRLPGSKVPWEFQSQRPDTDHFNRDYKPELARGGTEICRLDPRTGAVTPLTASAPPVWDFRCCESPDGRLVAFCRAETGGVPALWVIDADGGRPRLLTHGLDDQGADHPRWLPG
ncbi:MAG: serine/threonine protein kinase [Candidatus Latescibacterota bacterium]|jgi:TolB protein